MGLGTDFYENIRTKNLISFYQKSAFWTHCAKNNLNFQIMVFFLTYLIYTQF